MEKVILYIRKKISHQITISSGVKEFIQQFARSPLSIIGLSIILVIIFTALLSYQLAPYNPIEINYAVRFTPPLRKGHILGTDHFGRDILSRIIHGARASLWAGCISVGLAAIIGTPVGIFSGYLGGKIDSFIMRVMDVLLSFPSIVLAIGITVSLGPSLENAMIAIAIVTIPDFTRLSRGQTLSVKENLYIEAARAVGTRDLKILMFHILPNILGSIIVQITLLIGDAILTSAGLSFLGVGVQPPTPEWGLDISKGLPYLREAPWIPFFPGLFTVIAVLGWNLFGDGLTDILNPRLRD
jgi:peptide/nickel transport system permease protein